MSKGNYTALQQLKPTEIKVGELYNKWVDGYVKNGEAERAAKAKMLIEQKKSAQEINAKIDPKIVNTLLTFQPQINKIWDTIMTDKQKVGQMIDSGKMDSEYYALKSKNENMFSQYLQLSSILTNPQFLEADKKINEQIREGDIFEGDENMGRWMSIKSGMAQVQEDQNTGNIEVIYQNNIKSEDPNKRAKIEQLHEFASNYSSGVSKNLKSEIEEKLKAVSAEASKKINSDGITTYDSKAFNEVTARNTITQLMGLDPNKPVEEQFTNVNNLTPFAKQYFYGNGRLRFPENGEDLKVLVDDAVNFAKGYSNTSYGRVTSQSAADREGQYWDNKNKKKQFYKEDAPSVENNPLGSGTLSVGNVVLNIKTKGKDGKTTFNNHYQTQGLSYYVSGNTNEGKASKIGVTTYWNPNGGNNGKGGFSYAMNIPSKDGKEVVIEGVGAERAKQILASNKVKDPQNVLAMMATMAEQNNLSGLKPKGIGRGFGNYNVDFNPDKETATPIINYNGLGMPNYKDYTKK